VGGGGGTDEYAVAFFEWCRGENIFLQATALGLGTFIIGSFDDVPVRRVIGAPPEETPLYIMPVGKR
ncbi:MAG: nitroreductase family protein, partial [Chitinispirillaceae bacterium]|nr:nitroreductase family protein [Chitinispirillaceae bacterium]